MRGSDPGRVLRVTRTTGRRRPSSRWSFQHIADLFPTQTISRGIGPVATCLTSARSAASRSTGASRRLDGDQPPTTARERPSTASWHDAAPTAGSCCTRGQLLAEELPAHGMEPSDAAPADVGEQVARRLGRRSAGRAAACSTSTRPCRRTSRRCDRSGYAGATVRHLLDMRSGIAFSEAYLDEDAEVRLLEQAIGWAPRRHPTCPTTMYDFLLTLRQKGPHGGPFEYRSCETDVLGWVCEAAAGHRGCPSSCPSCCGRRIGAENDANIGVDSDGAGMFDGGISTALRDLARFGVLMRARAASRSPARRSCRRRGSHDSYAGGPDSREAFAASPDDNRMPGGMYRNQFWLPVPDRDCCSCLGIHGQMIYVNPACPGRRGEAVELADPAGRLEALLHPPRLRHPQHRPHLLAGPSHSLGPRWAQPSRGACSA